MRTDGNEDEKEEGSPRGTPPLVRPTFPEDPCLRRRGGTGGSLWIMEGSFNSLPLNVCEDSPYPVSVGVT